MFKPTVEDTNVKGAFLTEVSVLAQYPSTNESWLIGMTTGEGVGYIDSRYFKIILNHRQR